MTKLLLSCVIAFALAGCVNPADHEPLRSGSNMIPHSAIMAREGQDRIWFQATDAGVIYISDADTAEYVFFAPIAKNQRFILDVAHHLATVEGKKVYEQPMNKEHTYRLYFDPNGKPPEIAKEAAPVVLSPTPTSKPATAP